MIDQTPPLSGPRAVFSMAWPHPATIAPLLLALNLWLHGSGLAHAQQPAPAPLVSELSATRVVVGADGKEAQQSAAVVQPGDTVQYTAVYRNNGKAALGQVVASLPIPNGTELVPASAQPAGLQASVDGRTFAPLPLIRKVKQADGRWLDVLVPAAEIRFVRWPARALTAGQQFTTSLRVRVAAVGS